jgi:hypothetical protein
MVANFVKAYYLGLDFEISAHGLVTSSDGLGVFG